MGALAMVNDQNFETEVLQSEVPVMVDFYATWCGPCKSLTPIVEGLATDFDGKMKFVKLDIDQAPGVASSYGIMSVPTLIVFKGGSEVQKLMGLRPRPELQKVVESVI
jgi:thioredoxin 1